MRGNSSGLCPDFLRKNVCCEDLLVAFCLLLLSVERSKEFQNFWYGVVGPLLIVMDEERVTYENSVFGLLGEQQFFSRRGWAVHVRSGWHSWDFDATRGFPGEDILLL